MGVRHQSARERDRKSTGVAHLLHSARLEIFPPLTPRRQLVALDELLLGRPGQKRLGQFGELLIGHEVVRVGGHLLQHLCHLLRLGALGAQALEMRVDQTVGGERES